MSRFYPIKDDNAPETAWNFMIKREVRVMAHKKSSASKRAKAALKKIEANMKGKQL